MNQKNKCPVCWDFADEIGKEIFRCAKCDITFNEFRLSSKSEFREIERECN
ncbi:MAG TPA: hypothetical protein VJB11_00935 [archaeon]|nr:hypothetical protein [archaeon]